MRQGKWRVTPAAAGEAFSPRGPLSPSSADALGGDAGSDTAAGSVKEGGAEWCIVEHELSVLPAVPVPGPIAFLTKRIFVANVRAILVDLEQGIERMLAERG
jgi:hypothetical protein